MPAAVPPQFVLFSLLHWTMLSGIVAAACGWVAWARTHPSRARRHRAEEMVAYANLALWIVIRLYLLMPRQFKWSIWIPLGMCDIVTLLVSLKLLRPQSRWLSIALYFGGVGLCTNALITPDLKEGPLEFEFWAFWLRHAAIMVVAIYDLAVWNFRPNWNDWKRACVSGLGYVALVTAVNVAFKVNFGFLGDSLPGNPSVLDFLGPWPLRLLWVIAFVAVLWALMVAPWRLLARPRRVA